MFVGSVITIIGCLPQALSTNITYFLIARFVAGIGVGLVMYALPMFISEIVPSELRGALGSSMQLMMVVGTLIASVLNYQPWFAYNYSFAIPALPAALLASGIFFLPVSPRFALIDGIRRGLPDGGDERAWKSLRMLRGSDAAADAELNDLRASLQNEEIDASWSTLWREPSVLRRVFVAHALQWLQQFTGVNAILMYGPAIFYSAGVPLSPLACAIVISASNLASTFLMMLMIDRYGRRTLLLAGAGAMFLCLCVAGWLAHAIRTWASSNTALGWGLLVCVSLYMVAFAVSWGAVPWIYPSEIFPMSIKEKAMSTSVCSQWIANFVIAFITPLQVKYMGDSGTFTFYYICCGVAFLFVWVAIPETKGLRLEEMTDLFGELPEVLVSAEGMEGSMKHVGMAGSISSSCSFTTAFRQIEKSASVPASGHHGSSSAASMRRLLSDGGAPSGLPMPVVRSRICMAPGGHVALY